MRYPCPSMTVRVSASTYSRRSEPALGNLNLNVVLGIVALAQALIAMKGDRKILVLDEFTSALDSETEERILRNLEPWLAGQTVIFIAHRLCTVRKLAHRIVVLDRNGVVEEGTHEALIAQGGWYAEMARIQAVSSVEERDEIVTPVLAG
jgi:ABC-type transport system involved in Fe-S cluster assembly fused permease/ATPase subunit